jgi:hypothetical protein
MRRPRGLRLQDVNGVPIVGLCETPFAGVNEATKRASDMVIVDRGLLARRARPS